MRNRNGNTLKRLVLIFGLALLMVAPATAQSLEEFEKTVTQFTLANGMKFILVERHEVPIVAFHLYMDVGAVDENIGQTGVAHLFEHMAFKGTRTIGTKNYAREKKALEKLDAAYRAREAERAKGERADPARQKQLKEAFRKAQEEAASFVVTDEFMQIVARAGGVGLNASTSSDATRYHFSLPSNKIELWFALESLRFPGAGDPRILQRARRGDGRTADAHRKPSLREADRGVPGDCLQGAPLWTAGDRASQRSDPAAAQRGQGIFPPSTTWPPP